MKANIKVVIASLILSFIFIGCDTSSGGGSVSSVVGATGGTSLPVTITEQITDDGIVDSVTGVVSGSNIVTSARGDTPPSPPVIVSE